MVWGRGGSWDDKATGSWFIDDQRMPVNHVNSGMVPEDIHEVLKKYPHLLGNLIQWLARNPNDLFGTAIIPFSEGFECTYNYL